MTPPALPPGVSTQDVLGGIMQAELMGLLTGNPTLPCKDLLLRGYPPGSYKLTTITKRGSGTVSVTITDRNVTVPINIVANSDVFGRVIMSSGGSSAQARPTGTPDPKPRSGVHSSRC